MTLKIGIMSFAHVHAAGYCALLRNWPGVELLTADPDGDADPRGELRGAAFAAEADVAYVGSYQELFDWQPDAVIVCSENSRHRDLVLQAAGHGVHVMCEKPLATTVADGEVMVQACRNAGFILMLAYPVHFSEHFAALQQAVSQGQVGDLLAATGTNNGRIPVGARQWFTDPELSGGGALVDHVVHVAELLDVLVGGQQALWVKASTNQILHRDKPQVAAETGGLVTVAYPGGLIATIDCSWSHPDSAPNWGGLSLEVIGTRALVKIDPFSERVDGFSEAEGRPLWLSIGDDFDRAMLAAFVDAVRSGQVPQPDGDVGLRTLRIVCAAQESARTGDVVTV